MGYVDCFDPFTFTSTSRPAYSEIASNMARYTCKKQKNPIVSTDRGLLTGSRAREGSSPPGCGVAVSRSKKEDKQRCPFLRQREPIVWFGSLASRAFRLQAAGKLGVTCSAAWRSLLESHVGGGRCFCRVTCGAWEVFCGLGHVTLCLHAVRAEPRSGFCRHPGLGASLPYS